MYRLLFVAEGYHNKLTCFTSNDITSLVFFALYSRSYLQQDLKVLGDDFCRYKTRFTV